MSGQSPQRPTDTTDLERWLAAIDAEIAALRAERAIVSRAKAEATERAKQRRWKAAHPEVRKAEKQRGAVASPVPRSTPTRQPVRMSPTLRERLIARRAGRIAAGEGRA